MSFDPDVLLPTAFAATAEKSLDDALLACRNEQLDHDFLKFRDLAAGATLVGVASRDGDRARFSPRAGRVGWPERETGIVRPNGLV
jgi:hypothetical protein